METDNKLPIIMLTDDVRELANELGINEFLTKPVDSHDLLQKIATISKSITKESSHLFNSIIPSDKVQYESKNPNCSLDIKTHVVTLKSCMIYFYWIMISLL